MSLFGYGSKSQLQVRARSRRAVLTVRKSTARTSNEETCNTKLYSKLAQLSQPPSDAPKADALPEYPLTYTDETRVEKINFTIQ